MNRRMIAFILSRVLMVEGVLMLPSVICGLLFNEPEITAFALPIGLCLPCFLLMPKKPANTTIYAREGFFIVAASWILLSVVGALPLYLCGRGLSVFDCFFEIVSGFTTTGASVLANVEALPKCVLFWRSFTHWIGGMGVLVFILAIVPLADNRALHLMRAEVPGPVVGKLVPKMRRTATILYGVYSLMTVILIILLLAGGMPLFDAICSAFATAGTGGFSVRSSGILYYNSLYIEMVLSVFMLLFGVNFNLYYLLMLRRFKEAFKSEELRWYISIVTASTLLIAANIWHVYRSVGHSLRLSFFQVSSIITTTGFATANFSEDWPQFSQHIIVLLMILGACAGSTGGGLKLSRFMILLKSVAAELKHIIHPRAITVVRIDKKAVDDETLKGARVYFIAYILIVCFSTIALSLDGHDFTTNLSSVLTCFNNIGPGLAKVGPMNNFSFFSPWAKLLLSLNMLLGRLEIFPMLVMLSPGMWKRRAG